MRKPAYRDTACLSYDGNCMVRRGRVRGRREYLCRNRERNFMEELSTV